jgi:hypothetical protein
MVHRGRGRALISVSAVVTRGWILGVRQTTRFRTAFKQSVSYWIKSTAFDPALLPQLSKSHLWVPRSAILSDCAEQARLSSIRQSNVLRELSNSEKPLPSNAADETTTNNTW